MSHPVEKSPSLNPETLYREEIKHISKPQPINLDAPDRVIASQIVANNLGYVLNEVDFIAPASEEKMDLVQEGNLTLITAVDSLLSEKQRTPATIQKFARRQIQRKIASTLKNQESTYDLPSLSEPAPFEDNVVGHVLFDQIHDSLEPREQMVLDLFIDRETGRQVRNMNEISKDTGLYPDAIKISMYKIRQVATNIRYF